MEIKLVAAIKQPKPGVLAESVAKKKYGQAYDLLRKAAIGAIADGFSSGEAHIYICYCQKFDDCDCGGKNTLAMKW
jgi:hypothetical protein